MSNTIRPASEIDLPSLATWGQKLHEVERQFEPQLQFSLEEAYVRYQHELANPQALLLIVEDSGEPVGYLYAHIEPTPSYFALLATECVLEVIYLEPVARGKRFADQLIEKCIAWADDQNVWRYSTGIYAQNSSSLLVFQRLGFRPYHVTLVKP